jgi:hypothetical protein
MKWTWIVESVPRRGRVLALAGKTHFNRQRPVGGMAEKGSCFPAFSSCFRKNRRLL